MYPALDIEKSKHNLHFNSRCTGFQGRQPWCSDGAIKYICMLKTNQYSKSHPYAKCDPSVPCLQQTKTTYMVQLGGCAWFHIYHHDTFWEYKKRSE